MERTTRRSAAAAHAQDKSNASASSNGVGAGMRRRRREAAPVSTASQKHSNGNTSTHTAMAMSDDNETDASGGLDDHGNGNGNGASTSTRASAARDKKKKTNARAVVEAGKKRRKKSILESEEQPVETTDTTVEEAEVHGVEDGDNDKDIDNGTDKDKETTRGNGHAKGRAKTCAHSDDEEEAATEAKKQQQEEPREQEQEQEHDQEEHEHEEDRDHDHDHDHEEGEEHGSERVLRRSTRHERSMSIVSTASSTSSSATSEPTEEDRMAMWDEKLVELEEKKQRIEEGTHPEYLRRLADYKEEHDGLLQAAESQKTLQTKNRSDLYEWEIKRAHCVWKDMREAVKAELLGKADALLTKLRAELAQLETTGTLPNQRVLGEASKVESKTTTASNVSSESSTSPSTSEEEPDQDAVESCATMPPDAKRRKTVDITTASSLPVSTLRLPVDSITSDILAIANERDEAVKRLYAQLPASEIDLVIDRRRIIVGKYVFEEGDEVVLASSVLKEDVIGTITSVDDVDLFIKLANGPKVRVLMSHLLERRCEMRPFLRGNAGLESLQSNGWVECEPF